MACCGVESVSGVSEWRDPYGVYVSVYIFHERVLS